MIQMIDSFKYLYPPVRMRYCQVMGAWAKVGMDICPVETLRNVETQKDYYDRGRSKLLFGPHLFGLAIDSYPFAANKLLGGEALDNWFYADENKTYTDFALAYGNIAKTFGFRWGGDWDGDGDYKDQTFYDLVHIELTLGADMQELYGILLKGGIRAVWEYLDDENKKIHTKL